MCWTNFIPIVDIVNNNLINPHQYIMCLVSEMKFLQNNVLKNSFYGITVWYTYTEVSLLIQDG